MCRWSKIPTASPWDHEVQGTPQAMAGGSFAGDMEIYGDLCLMISDDFWWFLMISWVLHRSRHLKNMSNGRCNRHVANKNTYIDILGAFKCYRNRRTWRKFDPSHPAQVEFASGFLLWLWPSAGSSAARALRTSRRSLAVGNSSPETHGFCHLWPWKYTGWYPSSCKLIYNPLQLLVISLPGGIGLSGFNVSSIPWFFESEWENYRPPSSLDQTMVNWKSWIVDQRLGRINPFFIGMMFLGHSGLGPQARWVWEILVWWCWPKVHWGDF